MISIIVAVYNAEKYLDQCIESVINQSYKDFELILVDDGSTDGSLEICRKYEKQDNRIHVLQCTHRGIYPTRKAGVLAAHGNYITFLDNDDFVAERSYELAIPDMKDNADVICFDFFRYYNDNKITYDKCPLKGGVYTRDLIEKDILPCLVWNEEKNQRIISGGLSDKLIKSENIRKIYETYKDEDLSENEDAAISLPVILEAQKIAIRHEAFYYHRERESYTSAARFQDESYLDRAYNFYRCMIERMGKKYLSQIVIWYLYMVYNVKSKHKPFSGLPEGSVFPFDKVNKDEKIVLYGAGGLGNLYKKQLDNLNYCKIVLWIDKNFEQLSDNIKSPNEIVNTEFDKVVIAVLNSHIKDEIKQYLLSLGVPVNKII